MQSKDEKNGQIGLLVLLAMKDMYRCPLKWSNGTKTTKSPTRANVHDHHKAENRNQAYKCHQLKI